MFVWGLQQSDSVIHITESFWFYLPGMTSRQPIFFPNFFNAERIHGQHHLLLEPGRWQMLLQRDPRKFHGKVYLQSGSLSVIYRSEKSLGPEFLKFPMKKVSLWRKQMANSLLVTEIWPINMRRRRNLFPLNIKAINYTTEHVLI